MPIEVRSAGFVCPRCGRAYQTKRGNYPVCYGSGYKGTGFLSICRECFKDLYRSYLKESGDAKLAVRQMCRKLDIYWNEQIYIYASRKATDFSVMTQYLTRTNIDRYSGRSYDDTLKEEDRLWEFSKPLIIIKDPPTEERAEDPDDDEEEDKPVEIAQSVERYWGLGYDPSDYLILEARFNEMLQKLRIKREDLDIGTDKVIKQVCTIELDIEKARRAGKAVTNLQNTLNTYLGSANLKPSQQKQEDSDSLSGKPLGVLAQIYEEKRPIPEVDPSLADTDGVLRYITTWFLGHAAKMMKKNGAYVPLYERAMEKYRVRHPNLQGEDYNDAVDEEILDAELSDG